MKFLSSVYFGWILCLWLSPSITLAQNPRIIDSLQTVLNTDNDISDKQKVDVYNLIADQYRTADSIQVAYYTSLALRIAKKLNYREGIADAWYCLGRINVVKSYYTTALQFFRNSGEISRKAGYQKGVARAFGGIGECHTRRGNFRLAQQSHKKALTIYQQIKDESGIAFTYNDLGRGCFFQGKYPQALAFLQRSLKIKTRLGYERGMGWDYEIIGRVYANQGYYASAIKNYQTSLKIRKAIKHQEGMARSYSYLADVHRVQRMFIEATNFYKKSLEIYQRIGDRRGLAECYLGKGQVYLAQQKAGIAKVYFEKALLLRQQAGAKDMEASSWISLGMAYYVLGNDAEAKVHLEKGLQMAQKWGYLTEIRDGAGYMAKTCRRMGQVARAYEYLGLFKQMADSLLNRQNIRTIAQLVVKRKFEKKEDSLMLVQSNKELALNAEIKTQKANQKTTRVGAILLVVLLLVLGVFYHSKQQSNRRLNEANQELKEQRDYIVDSINYAQRIQKAILPLNESMQQILPPHFTFYQPKDVVSGDFYWFEEVDNKQVIVVADCTGHGVPGAFMTMLGTQALTNIVIQNRVSAPNQILNQLNKVVPQLLQSETTLVEDGMDAVVCVIDKERQLLHYAGAKNPLILIQNHEMKEIRGDRFSINSNLEREPQFTLHTIDISQPTTIYMYSDGYQDQFGGEKGRKFMKTQFQNLLQTIAHKPIAEQKQILETTLNDWMNYHGQQVEQIDDILVMGVQIS